MASSWRWMGLESGRTSRTSTCPYAAQPRADQAAQLAAAPLFVHRAITPDPAAAATGRSLWRTATFPARCSGRTTGFVSSGRGRPASASATTRSLRSRSQHQGTRERDERALHRQIARSECGTLRPALRDEEGARLVDGRRSSSELRRFRKMRALVGPILRPVSSAIGQPRSASSNGPYGGAMALDDGAEKDPAMLRENIRLLAEPDGRWAMIVDRAKPRDRDHQRPALAPALRLRDGEPCHVIGLRGVARQRWSAPRRCCARSGGLGR